jgi:hypothetical protein
VHVSLGLLTLISLILPGLPLLLVIGTAALTPCGIGGQPPLAPISGLFWHPLSLLSLTLHSWVLVNIISHLIILLKITVRDLIMYSRPPVSRTTIFQLKSWPAHTVTTFLVVYYGIRVKDSRNFCKVQQLDHT